MGKLVIKFKGRVVNEINLRLGETKIGRKPGSDIVLDDPIVSGEHAIVKTVGLKSTIEDLGSKNGTFIGNDRVKQRELKHGDTLIIGGYALTYRDEANFDAPVAAKPATSAGRASLQNVTTELVSFGHLVAIEGKDKDKRVPLIQDVVTIDNPGKNPAKITRTPDGYLLEAEVGPGQPRLNDKPIPPGGELLNRGDILDVAGTKYRFF